MGVIIKSVYEGQLNVKSIHTPSQSELITTAPKDNGGEGNNFSPTDLLVTSLSNCVLTIMALYAERNKIDLRGTTIYAEKIMSENSPRRIDEIILNIDMPKSLGDSEISRLMKCASQCPVKNSLRPDLSIQMNFLEKK